MENNRTALVLGATGGIGGVHRGYSADISADLPELDVEVWGRPHLDHVDMSPIADPNAWRCRT